MSRRLTTYKRPSIADLIAAAPNIETLGELRRQLLAAMQSGKMEADRKTIERWVENLWTRVCELMRSARTPSRACYVYNYTLRWEKSAAAQLALEQLLRAVVARLPDDVDLAALRGVVIEGISTPEQIAIAERTRAASAQPQTAA